MPKTEVVYVIARNMKTNAQPTSFVGMAPTGIDIRWVSEPLAARRFETPEGAIKFASKHFSLDTVYIAELKIRRSKRDEYH